MIELSIRELIIEGDRKLLIYTFADLSHESEVIEPTQVSSDSKEAN